MKTKKVKNLTGVFVATCLLVLVSSQVANAVCTGSSPTWRAANPSNVEISACINVASSGDTIIVPAGTANWTGSVRIPNNKKLTLQGSGVGVTTIGNSGTSYYLAIGLSGSRITGFTFDSMWIHINGSGFRIDHNYFYSTETGVAATGVQYDAGVGEVYAIPEGVIDNNTFFNGRVVAFGGEMLNHVDWTLPTGLGTGNDVIYIEDNVFNRTTPTAGNCIDGGYGGTYVFRYNTLNGPYLEAHSVQGANRAFKRWEIYGNLINKVPEVATYYTARLRGGTGVQFFNRITGNWSNRYIALDNVRSYSSVTTYGKCDGTHSGLDGNKDATGYPCRDQIGRGPDATLWVSPNGTYTQPLEPAYFFGNIGDSGAVSVDVINSSSDHIKANRDYYTYNASFDGKSGVGCGKPANRPATCSPGVAYWATEQSCTDMTGMVGANPSIPIKGTLYKCNASGQWETHYTPYTYPHPLRSGDVTKSTLLVTSVDGTVTSNPSGINCGSTCNANYDSVTSVTLTALANSGYKFSGWSGECSGTGTCVVDMAEARFVTANYTKSQLYSLAINKVNPHAGTVTGSDKVINCGSICTANYESGKSVTLTATPMKNYRFAGWSGACSGTGTCNVNMTAAKSATATFYWKTYTPPK